MNATQLDAQRTQVSTAHALADAVLALNLERPLVVALPPGGMALAAELARLLHAPLDLLLVGPGRATVAAPAGLSVSPLRERSVVLVHGGADDTAMHAALTAAHQLGAARVVLAVPEPAPTLTPTLAVLVDDLVGLPAPAGLRPAPGAGLPLPATLQRPGPGAAAAG
ncbi:MAG: hypothetical protein HY855_12045 [Burkholderiales bacterium]|nr:hypothetical protein [Burkholderiales bacterium]